MVPWYPLSKDGEMEEDEIEEVEVAKAVALLLQMPSLHCRAVDPRIRAQ